MTTLTEINLSLCDWETRAILESITREMARLKHINATSEDEDIQADAGNDYIELSGLYERLKDEAVKAFGDQILIFNEIE